VVGCSSFREPVDAVVVTTQFAFFAAGKASRQQVVDDLGAPRRDYEQGRIVTYLLRKNFNGAFEVINFGEEGALYNLVLSFGADDILTRYSLVRVQ
jgi:hypothetical protein